MTRDRVALVTGAAHRLGRAFAEALARSGHSVALHYHRSTEAAEATAEAIQEAGADVALFPADLSEPRAAEALVQRVLDHFGSLSVLVNSAARFDRMGLGEISPDAWDAMEAVNLRAPMFLTQAAAPALTDGALAVGEPSSVVNIGDLSGAVPWRGWSAHGATKAALLHFTRCAALELAPHVRVNAVVPGVILPPPGTSSGSAEWRAQAERNPMGEAGKPEDVAEAVCFLVKHPFITGQSLFVDGGEHLFGSTKRS